MNQNKNEDPRNTAERAGVAPANGSIDLQPFQGHYVAQESKDVYSAAEGVIALLLAVLAYLFVDYNGIGSWMAAVCTAAGCGLALTHLVAVKKKLTLGAFFGLLPALAVSAVYFLTDSVAVRFVALTASAVILIYWYACAFGNRGRDRLDGFAFFDILKTGICLPLTGLGKWFSALGGLVKSRKAGKSVKYILLGLLIAFIPCLIVAALLLNADEAFVKLCAQIFGDRIDFERVLVNLFLAFPLTLYLAGMIYQTAHRKGQYILKSEETERFIKSVKRIPALVTASFFFPLFLIYLVFFLSQGAYYFSAFSNLLPDGFTYAEYARRGFFELCLVASINLGLIWFASFFTINKEGSEKRPLSLRIFNILLSLFTLMLIATALRKMALYITNYGMTLRRLYPTWLMLLLALILVAVIVRQLIPKMNFYKTAVILSSVMLSLLLFVNGEALTAGTNVALYQNGTLSNVDVSEFYDLGGAAVPYAAKLKNTEDEKIRALILLYLQTEYSYYTSTAYTGQSVFFKTFPDYQAEKILRELYEEGIVKDLKTPADTEPSPGTR